MNEKQEVLTAVYGAPDRPLKIGEIEIPCYVLEGDIRVLSQRGLQSGIGMSIGGGSAGEQRMPRFIESIAAKGIDVKDLTARSRAPIKFIPPGGGPPVYGYEATILADICDAVLAARKMGVLQAQQGHIADQCEILLSGFARLGIIALVDEATGFQHARNRQALEQILDRFLRKELGRWAKRFPDEFYESMFRLRGWDYRQFSTARPPVVGKYTIDLVYARLAPGVLKELLEREPKNDRGRRKHHLHRWLTEDIGHPALEKHIFAVEILMKANTTWDRFYRSMQRALPKQNANLELSLTDQDGEPL
jgi:hypothetical protein